MSRKKLLIDRSDVLTSFDHLTRSLHYVGNVFFHISDNCFSKIVRKHEVMVSDGASQR